jgi:hypothetical protein
VAVRKYSLKILPIINTIPIVPIHRIEPRGAVRQISRKIYPKNSTHLINAPPHTATNPPKEDFSVMNATRMPITYPNSIEMIHLYSMDVGQR